MKTDSSRPRAHDIISMNDKMAWRELLLVTVYVRVDHSTSDVESAKLVGAAAQLAPSDPSSNCRAAPRLRVGRACSTHLSAQRARALAWRAGVSPSSPYTLAPCHFAPKHHAARFSQLPPGVGGSRGTPRSTSSSSASAPAAASTTTPTASTLAAALPAAFGGPVGAPHDVTASAANGRDVAAAAVNRARVLRVPVLDASLREHHVEHWRHRRRVTTHAEAAASAPSAAYASTASATVATTTLGGGRLLA